MCALSQMYMYSLSNHGLSTRNRLPWEREFNADDLIYFMRQEGWVGTNLVPEIVLKYGAYFFIWFRYLEISGVNIRWIIWETLPVALTWIANAYIITNERPIC